MRSVQHGRLLDPSAAPEVGEQSHEIVRVRNLVVEQVLSGRVDPLGYLQPEDEWALVLSGGAVLEVDGDTVTLSAGEWVFLPAGTPHRVLRVESGTNWVTIKLGAGERG